MSVEHASLVYFNITPTVKLFNFQAAKSATYLTEPQVEKYGFTNYADINLVIPPNVLFLVGHTPLQSLVDIIARIII